MQDGANKKNGTIVILLSLLLLGMDGKHREGDEWRQLEARQAQLAARIKVLKQEQDFLLFQRSFAGADSKYILIDLSTKTGTLKYRNRVLRTFGFTLSSSKSHKPRKGRYVLTGKTDGSPGKMSLVVQDAFIIHGKRYSGRQKREKSLPAMVVGRKDLAAIYYAVEQGTMLYV
ncbi:MAG: hypothetical protein HGB21_13595, partial [Nitrospirae bacterium]|nr:hypothetical protein [Nitrospirota bacterium]